MEFTDMVYRVIESQGIVATLLLIKMWQSSRLNAALIAKNCELQRFIMKCLSKELDEEHNRSNGSVASPSQAEPEEKADPWGINQGFV